MKKLGSFGYRISYKPRTTEHIGASTKGRLVIIFMLTATWQTRRSQFRLWMGFPFRSAPTLLSRSPLDVRQFIHCWVMNQVLIYHLSLADRERKKQLPVQLAAQLAKQIAVQRAAQAGHSPRRTLRGLRLGRAKFVGLRKPHLLRAACLFDCVLACKVDFLVSTQKS